MCHPAAAQTSCEPSLLIQEGFCNHITCSISQMSTTSHWSVPKTMSNPPPQKDINDCTRARAHTQTHTQKVKETQTVSKITCTGLHSVEFKNVMRWLEGACIVRIMWKIAALWKMNTTTRKRRPGEFARCKDSQALCAVFTCCDCSCTICSSQGAALSGLS